MLRAGVRGDIPGAPFDKGDALSMYRASFLHILAEGDCPGRLAREFMGMLMSKHPDTNLDVQHPDTGASPLMEACQSGNLVIARELIRYGADVNLPDKKGQTPLMCCCGEPATFHVSLTQAGANPWQRDKLGRSAIVHELVNAPHPYSGLFAMLSRHPVIPEEQQLITLFAAMHAGWDCLGILAAAGLRLDMQARYHGRTLLHELARCSSPWILISLDSEQFLMNFFQPEVMDERGNTPFWKPAAMETFMPRKGFSGWERIRLPVTGLASMPGMCWRKRWPESNNKKEKSCAPLVFRIFRRNMGCRNRKKSPRMMTACMNWPGSSTHTPSRRATRKRPSPISWRPRKDIRWKTSPSAPSPIYGWRRASPWKNRNCSRISVL